MPPDPVASTTIGGGTRWLKDREGCGASVRGDGGGVWVPMGVPLRAPPPWPSSRPRTVGRPSSAFRRIAATFRGCSCAISSSCDRSSGGEGAGGGGGVGLRQREEIQTGVDPASSLRRRVRLSRDLSVRYGPKPQRRTREVSRYLVVSCCFSARRGGGVVWMRRMRGVGSAPPRATILRSSSTTATTSPRWAQGRGVRTGWGEGGAGLANYGDGWGGPLTPPLSPRRLCRAGEGEPNCAGSPGVLGTRRG